MVKPPVAVLDRANEESLLSSYDPLIQLDLKGRRNFLGNVMEQHSIGSLGKSHFKHLFLSFLKGFLKVLYFALSHLPETTVIATVRRELTSR